ATGSETKTRVWNVANGKLVLELGKPALSVTYSPDGKYLVTGSEANTRIWNLNIGDLILE
ncbi:MAG TPA: hypothetical protein DC057_18250, partial [Spirochaetia bacterium]|nr:hypothetical protein [Spirochaetia bacterium]